MPAYDKLLLERASRIRMLALDVDGVLTDGQLYVDHDGNELKAVSTRDGLGMRALQRYGMILADNGSPWFLSGVPDPRWDNDVLRELRTLRGTDFEAVDTSGLPIDPDSAQIR